MPYPPYGDIIWSWLKTELNINDVATAAIMANLNAESSLIPYIVEGDTDPPYIASQMFTRHVDDGDYDRQGFIDANPLGKGTGYGLAGWTDPGRKGRLYDIAQELHVSVGSIDPALVRLKEEFLGGFSHITNAIRHSKDLYKSTVLVMVEYENPAEQSTYWKKKRYEIAVKMYKAFTGKSPPRLGMPIWMMIDYDR